MSDRDDLPHHPDDPEEGGMLPVWSFGAFVLVLLYVLALIVLKGRG
jgi:hypothetical protein